MIRRLIYGSPFLRKVFLGARKRIVNNFNVSVSAIENNGYINVIDNRFIITVLKLFPFSLITYLLKLFERRIIYKIDDIYYITGNNNTNILPIITNFSIVTHTTTHDMTQQIKFYNSAIPINFIISQNNINNPQYIKIKYMCKGKFIEKEINDFNECKLFNLFI